jgi:hypothetical protein
MTPARVESRDFMAYSRWPFSETEGSNVSPASSSASFAPARAMEEVLLRYLVSLVLSK